LKRGPSRHRHDGPTGDLGPTIALLTDIATRAYIAEQSQIGIARDLGR